MLAASGSGLPPLGIADLADLTPTEAAAATSAHTGNNTSYWRNKSGMKHKAVSAAEAEEAPGAVAARNDGWRSDMSIDEMREWVSLLAACLRLGMTATFVWKVLPSTQSKPYFMVLLCPAKLTPLD